MAEKMPITLGKWTAVALDRAIDLLTNLSGLVNATYPRELAESLKIIRDGYAEVPETCPQAKARGYTSKYPVLCNVCAATWARSTPARMIFAVDQEDGSIMWMATIYGIAFVMQNVGEPNTLLGCEAFLDNIPEGDEGYVYKLIEFYDAQGRIKERDANEKGN
jgi:hypothetical protein